MTQYENSFPVFPSTIFTNPSPSSQSTPRDVDATTDQSSASPHRFPSTKRYPSLQHHTCPSFLLLQEPRRIPFCNSPGRPFFPTTEGTTSEHLTGPGLLHVDYPTAQRRSVIHQECSTVPHLAYNVKKTYSGRHEAPLVPQRSRIRATRGENGTASTILTNRDFPEQSHWCHAGSPQPTISHGVQVCGSGQPPCKPGEEAQLAFQNDGDVRWRQDRSDQQRSVNTDSLGSPSGTTLLLVDREGSRPLIETSPGTHQQVVQCLSKKGPRHHLPQDTHQRVGPCVPVLRTEREGGGSSAGPGAPQEPLHHAPLHATRNLGQHGEDGAWHRNIQLSTRPFLRSFLLYDYSAAWLERHGPSFQKAAYEGIIDPAPTSHINETLLCADFPHLRINFAWIQPDMLNTLATITDAKTNLGPPNNKLTAHTQELISSNFAEATPRQVPRVWVGNGAFCVEKSKKGHLRFILNCKQANGWTKQGPDLPPCHLPSYAAIRDLLLANSHFQELDFRAPRL